MTETGKFTSFVVIRYTEGWLLWRLCSEKWPESKGKWTIPSARGQPGEEPIDTALRVLKEDAQIKPARKRLKPRFLQDAWREETKEQAVLYFFEYTWDMEKDVLPEFVPNDTTDKREWISCVGQRPEFVDMIVESAAHYIQRTWRYQSR